MKHADVVAVDIDVREIVQLLQHEMARIEQHLAARVLADQRMETLEADAVMQVFAGVDLVAKVDAVFIADIENRPAARQFIESRLDEAGGRCGNGNR